MSASPSIGIPELAGITSYRDAARLGYSVDETVSLGKRLIPDQ